MNILDFANPIKLWWALAAIPIIALYILKVRLRRVPVSTLLFWNELFDEKKPTAWWQRLRHWLSLLLQLAFLGLVVAALLDPLWSWQKDMQRRVVLVIDNSASMLAKADGGRSRLDEAKQAAKSLVRALRDGDQMAIVTAGGQPVVLWGMTDHGRWLIDAIEAAPVTEAPGAIEPALQLAKRLLSGLEGDGEIVLFTDGCSTISEPSLADKQIEVYGVGQAADNVGITRYQVRRSLVDAIGYQVMVDVTNYSERPQTCRVELDLNESLVDVLPIDLQPGQTAQRIVDHTSAAGGLMRATLDINDALASDNVALASLPTRRPVPVQLITEGDLFVRSVLQSIPLVTLSQVAAYERPETPVAVHVFDKTVPQALPGGPILVIDPQNDCDFWTVGDAIDQPIVGRVDAESPLTQHVRLDNIFFPGARQLKFSVPSETLIAAADDSPLLSRIPRSSGDIVVLTCSLDKGDLPLRIAFPVLMKNTIERFQGESGELRPAVATGRMVSVEVPSALPADPDAKPDQATISDMGVDDYVRVVTASESTDQSTYQLVAPGGEATPLSVSGAVANVGPLQRVGLWRLKRESEEGGQETAQSGETEAENRSDESIISIACNLVSQEESNLIPTLDLPRAKELDAVLLGGRSLWFYLTLFASGLIATEWWLFHRRIVG